MEKGHLQIVGNQFQEVGVGVGNSNSIPNKTRAIKILRLITGEEIIGYYQNTGYGTRIERPLRILVDAVPGSNGRMQVQLQLIEYIPLGNEKEFSINEDHITLVYEPKPEMTAQYIKQTSNIIMPGTNKLV